MKKLILFFFAIMLFSSLSAQEADSNITVKSLTELSNDTEASVARKLDSRDKKCALIKVRTPNLNAEERGKFSFQGDAGTEVFPEKATGELKLYLTEGAKRLRIMHDDYGVVEYSIQIPIVGFRTYKMEIVVDKGAVAAAAVPATGLSANYVEINVEPSDATVLIDDNPVTDGTAYLEIDVDHTLTVSKAMYHTHTQIIRANKNKKMVYDVKLTPAFGWLRIVSQPEGGATVFVDGMEKGKTPLTTAKLESGEHTIRLIKEMFEPLEKTVNVRDNDTSTVTLKMRGNFADVTLNITDPKAEIYIDGKKKSDGPWSGRVAAGTHLIEAKRQYHTMTLKEITCAVGVPQTVTLESPKPIIGSMNIKSNPSKAKIYLDGKDMQRTTPDIIQDVYAGEHRLKIEKEGYSTYDETVIVKENEMTSIEVELASTKEVTITTDKAGDKIYIDDKYIGTSPVKTVVKYGENKITIESGAVKETKTVTVDNTTEKIHVQAGAYVTINTTNYADDVIYIDGKRVTSITNKLSLGEHHIVVKNYRGITRKKDIVVDGNEKQIININSAPRRSVIDITYGIGPNGQEMNMMWAINYEYKFYPHTSSFSPGMSFKTGIIYENTNYLNRYEKYEYGERWVYMEYVDYDFINIPLLAKVDFGNHRYSMWVDGGLMYSINAGVSQDNYKFIYNYSSSGEYPYTIKKATGFNGMNLRFDAGINLSWFVINATYIYPLHNNKTIFEDGFSRWYIVVGFRFGKTTYEKDKDYY